MDLKWSLDELYKSFDTVSFKGDFQELCRYITDINKWGNRNLNDSENCAVKLEEYIAMLNNCHKVYSRMYDYAQLVRSVDVKNNKALQIIEELEKKKTEIVRTQVLFQKWLCSLENLNDIIKSSSILEEHDFYLNELIKKDKYTLGEKEEELIAILRNTGSYSWSKVYDTLVSTHNVNITINGEAKRLPLPIIRNMAYDNSSEIRKTAYEAELKSYVAIKDFSAVCLNNIKGESINLCGIKGYESPLKKVIIEARLEPEVLDAMFEAIRGALPVFRRYYRKKAEMLGHSSGRLPFYDLFAPIGKINSIYTYEQARELIVKSFSNFSGELADFADNAFEKRWIDVEPKEGKAGGAFCRGVHSIKESRILTNFSGSFGDVVTIAHELGHAYHNHCLKNESFLNINYTNPIAETASIFCETIVTRSVLSTTDEEEVLTILEQEISSAGQVIVDIFSRFLFEREVFTKRKAGSLSSDELEKIMLNAQIEAYGEGLDHESLHPFMWVCKPHYYIADGDFYNFPYSFGLLFSKGLYSEYLKNGDAFLNKYDAMLSVTGKMDITDAADKINVDIRSVEYWRNALRLIEDDINRFVLY